MMMMMMFRTFVISFISVGYVNEEQAGRKSVISVTFKNCKYTCEPLLLGLLGMKPPDDDPIQSKQVRVFIS